MGTYENTLEDIEATWGIVPSFMKAFPRSLLVNDWPSWKKDDITEIDLERAGLLLNVDDMLEEMLG